MNVWIERILVVAVFLMAVPAVFAQSVVLADGGVEFPDGSIQSVAAMSVPGPLAESGQSSCFDAAGNLTTCGVGVGAGQEGHVQPGVEWPIPRFTENGDGTVTDNMTGLIWLENANCAGTTFDFDGALSFANTLWDGSTSHGGGDCGLSDGSVTGDWRVPNMLEAVSLLDHGYYNPGLPNTTGTGQWTAGDPFTNIQSSYWTSTFNPQNYQFAHVLLFFPRLSSDWKTNLQYVWPVRGPSDSSGAPAQAVLILADGGIKFPDGSVQSTAGGAPRVVVPKTGQTSCYSMAAAPISCAGTGQDGDHQAGVAWPDPRFTKNEDGTVTDNLTGLVWLEDANCNGLRNWASALTYVNTLYDGSIASGGVGGDCGLSDGSLPGEWRLPTAAESYSLAFMETQNPAIPNTAGTGQWTNGDPFLNIVTGNVHWWTSTSLAWSTASAHGWFPRSLLSDVAGKSNTYYVWPVRAAR